jgi:hypothetical protein
MARPPGGALHDIKKKRCMDTTTEPFEFGTKAVPNSLTCMHPGGPTRRGSRPVAVGGSLVSVQLDPRHPRTHARSRSRPYPDPAGARGLSRSGVGFCSLLMQGRVPPPVQEGSAGEGPPQVREGRFESLLIQRNDLAPRLQNLINSWWFPYLLPSLS